MPKIEKAERRDARRRKARDNAAQGVRTATLRAGQSLLTMEVRRKTKLKKRRKGR